MRGLCEHPEHEGDVLVDRRDLLERRIEWRRLTDQGREHVRIVRRECKACMRVDLLGSFVGDQAAMPL